MEFIVMIKDVVMKNYTALFGVPVNKQPHKYSKRGKHVPAGRQTALGHTTSDKMTVPTIVDNNARSLFGKLPGLPYLH
ncbi:unnamed protein product [Echinostoma caproni]|uniref:Transposase n=1 Tax=Echinostoma caproni TaxID=27848 RepID=A0A183A841_9TREM|nr:unnamed protein product [Echinostoma caproni]